jgi:hypothetical protein
MGAMITTPRPIVARPWFAATLVATVFVGANGLWNVVALFAFLVAPGPEFGTSSSMAWDIVRSEWGIHLAYLTIAAVAAGLLWRSLTAHGTQVAWPLVARSVVAYIPVAFVITFVIGFVTAIVQGYPFAFFGFEILSR